MDNSLELFDRDLLLKINSFHNDWVDIWMWAFSQMFVFAPVAVILLFFYYKRYKLRNTVALILCCGISIALTDLSTNAVKHMVKRYRPTHNIEIKDKLHIVKDWDGKEYIGGKYGFFSAHASNSVGVTTVLFLAASWINRKWRFLLFLIPFLIIYSRMYIGVHYPSDVFIGTLDGIIFGYSSFLIFRKYFFKSPLADE